MAIEIYRIAWWVFAATSTDQRRVADLRRNDAIGQEIAFFKAGSGLYAVIEPPSDIAKFVEIH